MTTQGISLRDGGNMIAAADYSTTGQFYAVRVSTAANRTVVLETTGGVAIYGILQNGPKSGEAADVTICGLTKAKIGAGGVTRGDLLMTENTGKLVTQTSTNVKVGRALESANADEIALVEIFMVGA